jgi:hypothetical protein
VQIDDPIYAMQGFVAEPPSKCVASSECEIGGVFPMLRELVCRFDRQRRSAEWNLRLEQRKVSSFSSLPDVALGAEQDIVLDVVNLSKKIECRK